MSDPTVLPFGFPTVRGKKLIAAFDGGRLTSDGGVLLLAQAARRLGIAEKLAAVIPDRRDPSRVLHPLPESGPDLMSQPTVSRLENTPGLRDLIRLGRVLVDLYCASYATPPEAVTLDIDDTCDVVHGQQQLLRTCAISFHPVHAARD